MFFIETLKWGSINSLYYFYPHFEDRQTEILSQTFYFLVVVGSCFLPVLYFTRHLIASLFNATIIVDLILPISLYFFFMLTSLILDHIFILEKKSHIVIAYEIINKTLRGIMVIGAAIIYSDVNIIIWSLTIFAFMRFFLIYFYMKNKYGIKFKNVDSQLLISQLKYAFPIGAARMVGQIGNKIDKFILTIFLTPAHFAAYSVAHFGVPFIGVFYSSVSQVVIPQITLETKSNNLEEITRLWHSMINKFILVSIPVLTFFLLVAEYLISFLFTEQYLNIVTVYRVSLFIILIHTLHPSIILRAFKETKSIFYSHLFSMIFAIVISYVLIKNYGMIGGALSFILSSSVRVILQLIKVKEVLTLTINNLLPWNSLFLIIGIALISLIPSIFLIKLEMNNLETLLLSGICYSAVLIPFYHFSGVLKYKEVVEFVSSVIR